MKCDESRPACRRCVSTGRTCDGYGIWGGGGTPYGQPQSNRALSIYCTPVPAGSLTREEQTHFDWLMEKTTKKFAGLFRSDFWETLVFQASAQEPAVRHAVIALSAAHRFEQSHDPWTIPAIYGFNAERFTLQQYNKAIYCLRVSTASDNKNSLRVALIACLIFTTLEYLRGQYTMGSAHLRYGIQLLANISSPTRPTTMAPRLLCPAEDFAHSALIDSYSRLSIQCAMFGHVPSDLCVMTRDPQTHSLPYLFASLREARQTLDDLLNRIHCLKRHYYTIRESSERKEKDYQDTRETQSRILSDLSLWRKAYNNSLARAEDDNSRREKFGYLLLRVYHEMATIMAAASHCPVDEMIFDSFTGQFHTILESFVELWTFWGGMNIQTKDIEQILKGPECGGHGFTVESGYIPPVYYTALKCRIPRIRRQAVRALRSAPHREGVWNGPLLADVLVEVIKIEEGGFYADDLSVNLSGFPTQEDLDKPLIPESSRISDPKIILPDVVNGDTYLSYKKRDEDGGWLQFKRKVEPELVRSPVDRA